MVTTSTCDMVKVIIKVSMAASTCGMVKVIIKVIMATSTCDMVKVIIKEHTYIHPIVNKKK